MGRVSSAEFHIDFRSIVNRALEGEEIEITQHNRPVAIMRAAKDVDEQWERVRWTTARSGIGRIVEGLRQNKNPVVITATMVTDCVVIEKAKP